MRKGEFDIKIERLKWLLESEEDNEKERLSIERECEREKEENRSGRGEKMGGKDSTKYMKQEALRWWTSP